jgi:hypothetical protein
MMDVFFLNLQSSESVVRVFCLYTRITRRTSLYLPHACTLVPCLAYSGTMKMKAISSSETSVDYTVLYSRR